VLTELDEHMAALVAGIRQVLPTAAP
jgi:hypothetical protein